MEAGTNTASEPACQPPGTARPWRRGHLDYAPSPATTRTRRRPKTWAYGWTGSPQSRSSPWQSVSNGCLLRSPATSRREPAPWQTSHSAIRRGTGPPATMVNPGEWHYVATRLMAHMGAYSPDEMNRLQWQWHQGAALRTCTAMQRHNVWDIPGSPGYQGHAPGHRRPRSKEIPEPPRQAARRNPLERHQGPPPGVEGQRQSSHLRGARRHPGAAPGDKEPWPHPAPQPHAASCSTASRLPREYTQRPWKSQRPPRPMDVIYH